MAASTTQTLRKIPSLHNFRPVTLQKSDNSTKEKCNVFRSSRPDFLKETEIEAFKSLGIKCIIDLRSEADYRRANGQKLLQTCGHFKSYVVKYPDQRNYKPGESVEFHQLGCKHETKKNGMLSDHNAPKHFLIDFFTVEYIKAIIKRAPWYIKLLSIFVLIFDLVFRTDFNHFVRLYARNVINPAGLTSTYIDIAEMSQRSISAALKLLCQKEHIPALINCAHGKDRTGIVSAMVLAILGETNENIIADYHRSEEGLEPVKQRVYEEVVKKYNWDISFVGAKPQTMQALLQFIITKYGSVENYLEFIGFGKSEQEQLRRNLGYGELED